MAMLELKEAFYRGIICKQYVSVAQWIERRFPKPCVGGSNRKLRASHGSICVIGPQITCQLPHEVNQQMYSNKASRCQ